MGSFLFLFFIFLAATIFAFTKLKKVAMSGSNLKTEFYNTFRTQNYYSALDMCLKSVNKKEKEKALKKGAEEKTLEKEIEEKIFKKKKTFFSRVLDVHADNEFQSVLTEKINEVIPKLHLLIPIGFGIGIFANVISAPLAERALKVLGISTPPQTVSATTLVGKAFAFCTPMGSLPLEIGLSKFYGFFRWQQEKKMTVTFKEWGLTETQAKRTAQVVAVFKSCIAGGFLSFIFDPLSTTRPLGSLALQTAAFTLLSRICNQNILLPSLVALRFLFRPPSEELIARAVNNIVRGLLLGFGEALSNNWPLPIAMRVSYNFCDGVRALLN